MSRLDQLTDRESAPFAALAGAVVTVVLSVIPFSPVLGGAVAAVRDGGGVAGVALDRHTDREFDGNRWL